MHGCTVYERIVKSCGLKIKKKKRKKRKKGKHANRKTQMRNVNPNPILNLSIKEGKKRQGRRGTKVGICAIFYTLIIEGERI